MSDRDALLPRGSITGHHIDSHDTFWWPTWGKKWRREQFTAEQFRLLTVIFGSLPGPFMMFTGGELGIEDLLPPLRALKDRPEWRGGAVSFGLTRSLGGESTTVLANFAGVPVTVAIPQFILKRSSQRVLFTAHGDAAPSAATGA